MAEEYESCYRCSISGHASGENSYKEAYGPCDADSPEERLVYTVTGNVCLKLHMHKRPAAPKIRECL
jgi:hypothetical protein